MRPEEIIAAWMERNDGIELYPSQFALEIIRALFEGGWAMVPRERVGELWPCIPGYLTNQPAIFGVPL